MAWTLDKRDLVAFLADRPHCAALAGPGPCGRPSVRRLEHPSGPIALCSAHTHLVPEE